MENRIFLGNKNNVLSASIVEYYLMHGKNRDLERFLRLRSRSSSDCSLHVSEDNPVIEKIRISKSMENLTKLQSNKSVEVQEVVPEITIKPDQKKEPNETKQSSVLSKEPSKIDPNNIKVKFKQSKKEKHNFNVESIIEINFPQNPPQMLNPFQPTVIMPEFKPISYSTDTQTQQNESTSMEASNVEEPIQPVLHTPIIKKNTILQASPISNPELSPSSVASENKQKLEWDSLGDLGYQMNEKYSLLTLNNADRKVLKTYFDQRGINFDDKVVVLKNDTTRMDPENERKLRLGAIKRNKEKWQKVYNKYKGKYYDSNPDFEEPDAQSTPKIESFNKNDEKSSQTSLVKIISKGTQADESPPALPPRKEFNAVSSVLENIEASIFFLDQSRSQLPEDLHSMNAEIAESFSYIPGSSKSTSTGNSRNSAISYEKNRVHEAASALLIDDTTNNSSVSSILSGKKTETSAMSIFDEELKVAITLLNSLLDSKHMNPDLKKSLASKIIQKISKIQTSRSIQTSTRYNKTNDTSSHNYSEVHPHTETSTSQGVSGISTFSQPSKRQSTVASKKSSSSNDSRDRVLKEFLQPMTHSELDYQNLKLVEGQKNIAKPKKNKRFDDKEASTIATVTSRSQSVASKRNLPLLDFVRKEKQSQLNWIEKEILHLNNLRDLLAKNVDTSSNTTMRSEAVQTSIVSENNSYDGKRKDSKSDESKLNSDDSKKSKSTDIKEKRKKTQTESSSKECSQSNTSNKDTSNEKPIKAPKNRFPNYNDWDSHANLKKILKNRSKLETPHTSESDESLVSFINKRKDKFLEKYEKKKQIEIDDDEALYTKPYSSREAGDTDHYSEPIEKRNMQHQSRQNPYSTSKNSLINASTSLASSEVFVSSHSISIPIVNSTNNTTTHHYDLHVNKHQLEAKGTQTSDSIAKTKPIFERKFNENAQTKSAKNTISTNTHTKREDQTRNHKQMQTSPKSIKYILTFDHQNRFSIDRKFCSLPQVGVMSALKSSKDLYNHLNSNSLDNKKLNDEEKENWSDKVMVMEEEHPTVLETCLNEKRPDIWHKFEERKRCILQLKNLRIQRNEQRKKLLLLTSDSSLVGKLARLPPSPLSQQRIFTTKALKMQTQKQYQNLPEVQKKKEIENINNLKRKNRLMTDIFNKNLQRKVLKGQTFLSNSVNLLK